MDLSIRRIEPAELESASAVMEEGRAFLKISGSSQWQHGRPDMALLSNDIIEGTLFGLFDGDRLALIAALSLKGDRSYDEIYDGAWLTSGSSYLTLHTFAVSSSYRGRGLSKVMLDYASAYAEENGAGSVRADTYKKNAVMQHILLANGFRCCGIIYLKDEKADNDRLAYEKTVMEK